MSILTEMERLVSAGEQGLERIRALPQYDSSLDTKETVLSDERHDFGYIPPPTPVNMEQLGQQLGLTKK